MFYSEETGSMQTIWAWTDARQEWQETRKYNSEVPRLQIDDSTSENNQLYNSSFFCFWCWFDSLKDCEQLK